MPSTPAHPTAQPEASPGDGKLTLLVSYGGWQDDPWVDRLPPLLEPMGVRSVRADTARAANEVLRTQPVHIAVVDLGVPLDSSEGPREAGTRVLELISRLASPPPSVVIKRAKGHREDAREMAAALRAGAFAVIDRPRGTHDLERLLEVLRRCMTRHYAGRWPSSN